MIQQWLLELQWQQLRHDELYHREIARLTVGDRMKHMALHLAKYVGHFAELDAQMNNDRQVLQNLVDVYIISMSSANTVNLDLGRALHPTYGEVASLLELGQRLIRTRDRAGNAQDFTHELAIGVGRLAKACESLDHVEAFPFREGMQAAVLTIFETVVAETARRRIDLASASNARLDEVRGRHIFDGHLRPALAIRAEKVGQP
jgi:hypothetical protein